ncbi:hypothetical protein IscW_ISCW003440 [Ixodes scapularis]|uniref:Secreted protein n=1 Tax=Ixodes scapularis TaxID=6945 RepID=B7PA21_IXOSC|nr:hypothetical protein IscW_ISCW003440 [Ixodes scapularis]|eukprot:XP_002406079.1 hypothetical protein IscW_ISCW003440 [Ixodes scapularis]
MLSLMLPCRCARTSFILMCTFPSCPSCIVEEGRCELWRTPQTLWQAPLCFLLTKDKNARSPIYSTRWFQAKNETHSARLLGLPLL